MISVARVVCIEDPSTLAPDIRDVLKELSRREFVPDTHRICRISGDSEPSEWEVERDCGLNRFVLERDDHVRRLERNRIAIKVSHDMRYVVTDVNALDKKSRRILESYI